MTFISFLHQSVLLFKINSYYKRVAKPKTKDTAFTDHKNIEPNELLIDTVRQPMNR